MVLIAAAPVWQGDLKIAGRRRMDQIDKRREEPE
jgi:hypothetical protein